MLIIRIALLGAALLSTLNCGSASCDAAAEKLRNCLSRLDCNRVDPTDRQTCVSTKSQTEKSLGQLEGVPCVAEIADLAEQVDHCNPQPANFCRCL